MTDKLVADTEHRIQQALDGLEWLYTYAQLTPGVARVLDRTIQILLQMQKEYGAPAPKDGAK